MERFGRSIFLQTISGGVTALALLVSIGAHAASISNNLTVEGRFYHNGAPINEDVDVIFEILDNSKTCVLYRESATLSVGNATDTNAQGVFSYKLGTDATPDFNAAGSLYELFVNSGTLTGDASCVYTPSAGDTRHVRIQVKRTNVVTDSYVALSPDTIITAVPTAMVAESVQGKTADDLITVRDDATYDLSQGNVENIFSSANYAKLIALLAGTSNQYLNTNPSSTLSFNNQRLANVGTPTLQLDAVNKGYADSTIGGKAADSFANVGPAAGDGLVMTWDQAANKWTAKTMTLPNTGVTAGTYGSTNTVPTFTVAADGRLSAAANVTISGVSPGGAAGGDLTGTYPNPTIGADKIKAANIKSGYMVNRLVATDPVTPNNLTYFECASIGESPMWSAGGWVCANAATLIGNSGVTPSTYGNATNVATLTVDAQGRITAATNTAITYPVSSVNGKSGAITLNAFDLGLGTAALKAHGTAAGELVELDGSGKIPVALLPASAGDIGDVVAGNGLLGGASSGSAALSVNVGTGANQIVQLDGTSKLPAVDGSNLTSVNATKLQAYAVHSAAPADLEVLTWNGSANRWEGRANTHPVTSVAGKTGVVTLRYGDLQNGTGEYLTYQPNGVACGTGEALSWDGTKWICSTVAGGDITDVTVGVGLLGGASSGAAVISVNVGTSANQIVQLDGTAKLPPVDGSNLTAVNATKLQAYAVHNAPPTAGQVLKWNAPASRWEGSADQDSGGDITDVVAGAGLLGGGANGSAALSVNVGTSANQIVQLDGTSKLPAVDGSALTAVNASKLQTFAVHNTPPADLEVLTWNNSAARWEGRAVPSAPVASVAGRTGAVTLTYVDLGNSTGGYLTYRPNATACTAGEILSWDGSKWICAVDANSGGDITAVVAGTGLTGGGLVGQLTLDVNVGTGANQIVQLDGSSKLPAVDGSALTSVSATKLQSYAVHSAAPGDGQILKWNGPATRWEPAADNDSGDITSVTAGSGLLGGGLSGNAALSVNTGTGANQIVQLDGTSKLPAVDGSALTSLNASKLQTYSVHTAAPADLEVLTWNGSAARWEGRAVPSAPVASVAGRTGAVTLTYADLGNSTGGYLTYRPNATACTAGEILSWDGSRWICAVDANSGGDITAVVAGTGLTGGGLVGQLTLDVNVGTGANQLVQLDGTSKLPAVDGSNVFGLAASKVVNVPAGNIVGTTVQLALNELDNEKLALTGGGITGILGLNTQSQIHFKDADSSNYISLKSPGTLASNYNLILPWVAPNAGQFLQASDGVGNLTWGSFSAVNIANTPAGNLASTDVQSALNELDGEKLNLTGGTMSGAIQGFAGTISLPGYSFASDTDTGLSRPSADTLALSTSGSDRMLISSSGNVALGRTPTSARFHAYVNSATDAGKFENAFDDDSTRSTLVLYRSRSSTTAPGVGLGSKIVFNGEGNSDGSEAEQAAITGYWESPQTNATTARDGVLAFYTSLNSVAAERMRITSSGTVGIGVTDVSRTLHISGAIRLNPVSTPTSAMAGDLFFDSGASNSLKFHNGAGWVTVGSGSGDFMADGSVPMTGQLDAVNGSAASPSYSFANSQAAGMFRSGANAIGFSTSSTERMTISSDGRVGVGTTTPSNLFEIRTGDVGQKGLVITNDSANSVSGAQLSLKNDNADSFILQMNSLANSTYPSTARLAASADHLLIESGNDMLVKVSGSIDALTIDNTGKIGVGTTSPRGTLDVNGPFIMKPAVSTASAVTTFDFASGNTLYTPDSCSAGLNLHNLKEGGHYYLVFEGTSASACSFNSYTGAGSGAITTFLPANHGPGVAGEKKIYEFHVANGKNYVSWNGRSPGALAFATSNRLMLGNGSAALSAMSSSGSSGQMLVSQGAAAPTWTSAIYPTTVSSNSLIYATSTDTIGQLNAPGSVSVLVTSGSGAPQWLNASAPNTFLRGGATPSFSAVNLNSADVTGVLSTANGGTGVTNPMYGYVLQGGQNTAVVLGSTVPSSVSLMANGTTLMTLHGTSGNIGVGTFAPSARMHIQSSGGLTNSNMAAQIENLTTSSTNSINKIGLDIQSTGLWNGSGSNNTGLRVMVAGGTTNYAATFQGGNVGVGTSNPNYLLDVSGTARANVMLIGGTLGLAFAGDTNTGLSLPNTNSIALVTMGTSRLTIDGQGVMSLAGSSSGVVALRAPASGAAATLTLPSSPGSTGQVLSTNGSGTLSWQDRVARITTNTITTSGSYTAPASVMYVKVEVVGGGGGGASAGTAVAGSAGSGGGSGGYALGYFDKSVISTPVSITVGSGGAAGVTTTAPGSGNMSSFGALMVANGGAGGTMGTAASVSKLGGAGGTVTSGPVQIPGEPGSNSFSTASGTSASGGKGGNSPFGRGGQGGIGSAGGAGSGYGSGGGGGASNGTNTSGGAGAPGVVIITEYHAY